MGYSIFSTAGCMRCSIVKSYMQEHRIEYREFDFKTDGKEEFNAFYRKNRSSIYRGDEGVEFPLLYDGAQVVQGVGVIIAFFENNGLLGGAVSRSELSHGWVSGLDLSLAGGPLSDSFVDVVTFLKVSGLNVQIGTDGHHSSLLQRLVDKSCIDRLVFNIWGPVVLYEAICGIPIDEPDLAQSLSIAQTCPEYQIHLPLKTFKRDGGASDIITPEEAGLTAAFIEQATGKKTHPFYLKNSISAEDQEMLGSINLFKYRTACRRYMVKTEILKDE